jgi:hypothetical protein
MGCRWITVKGKRTRVGATTPVAAPLAITELSIELRLASLGLGLATHSPGYTIEELKDAIIRLWKREEGGDLAEVRMRPGAPPIYHVVTPEQAKSIESGDITPELIADLVTSTEPTVE